MILIFTGLANAQQTQGQTPAQPPSSTANLQADQASGGNSVSTIDQQTAFNNFCLANLNNPSIICPASGGNSVSTIDQQTATSPGASYEAYWLGGSVLYNGGSLTYTWTDKTSEWPGKTTNHVNQAAWAAGYDKPTAWSGKVNTFINNDGKIGLNTGNDMTNFICQYDIPMTVKQLLQSGMYQGKRRSLF